MKREVIYLLVSTFILVLAWIGFSVYDNYTTSTITPAVTFQIAPIQSSFDLQTIEAIKQRIKTPPLFEMERTATPAATATLTPIPTISVTPVASVSSTPTPTASISATPTEDELLL